jgi:hypothetical protein
MEPDNTSYFRIHKKLLLVIVLILAAVFAGWMLGRNGESEKTAQTDQPEQSVSETDDSEGLDSKISYQLPDGWKQQSCEGSEAVFIAPNGTSVNCEDNPASAVKLSVDSANTDDCNQLQNVSDVKKHTCISLYINDQKSLKASTEYLESSPYNQAITVESYYIDTGDGVIKAEYSYTSGNEHQRGFDQLVNSIKAQ